jgi:formylglycine-generating enzyme required for sulfatase activity
MTRTRAHRSAGLMALGLLLLPVPHSAAEEAVRPAPPTAAATPPARPAWAAEVGSDRSGAWADLVVGATSQRMRWIVPGAFTMGSPADEADRDRDEAQHQVILSQGYWLGDSEITRSFWQAVMGAPADGDGGALPVTVSWEDGQAFFARLNGMKPELGAGFPTEAQWEYACRAGTSGPTHAPLDTVAWYLITSADAYGNNPLHPVKQKQPNAWGLHDMLGNAWESTRDWYGVYPTGTVSDPTGPASGIRHVVRGGSSRNAAGCCRAAWRWAEFPGAKGFGLRIAANAKP